MQTSIQVKRKDEPQRVLFASDICSTIIKARKQFSVNYRIFKMTDTQTFSIWSCKHSFENPLKNIPNHVRSQNLTTTDHKITKVFKNIVKGKIVQKIGGKY